MTYSRSSSVQRSKLLSRLPMVVALAGALSLLGACTSNQINADTLCRDYLQVSMAEREHAVQRIAVDLEVSGAGHPFLVLNVDTHCGSQLDTPVGDIVARQQY